jgi:hypothetical protein
MRGIGFQPAGASPAGFGAPTQTGLGANVVLPDVTVGGSHGSRKINPVTRDYVLTDDGRLEGMNNVQQLVQLAVTKAALKLQDIDRLDNGFESAVLSVLTGAVQSLVTQGLIEVLGVSVRMNAADGLQPGQAATVFRWRDLTTTEEQATPV